MFSLHCFEGLEIKSCCGKRRKRGDDGDSDVVRPPGIVVTVNSKAPDEEQLKPPLVQRRQAWSSRPSPSRKKNHHRRRRPGQHDGVSHGSHRTAGATGGGSSNGSSLVHRRVSAASNAESVVVRETLAMVDTYSNWLACLTQGNVDFSLPAKPSSMFGTCIVSPERLVMSLSGFAPFVSLNTAQQHVNDVFQTHFASLVLSLVNTCFAQKTASAIRIVCKRQPFNVVAYPLTVRESVEGVLLVYREDQVTPAEFSNLIVSANR
jgi:hypothetical protein